MIEFLAVLLFSMNAGPSIQLINPEFLFPQRAPSSENGDTFTIGGQDGEVAIHTANGWEYSRIPGSPTNQMIQILWHQGKLIALTKQALYIRDPSNKSWNLIFSNSNKSRASIATYEDTICYLNSSVGFTCSQDGGKWNTIDSYALDAIIYRGKSKWMAFDGVTFYDYDSSRWNYHKDYSSSGAWEVVKSGLIKCSTTGVRFFSSNHEPEWTAPVKASVTLSRPNGLIVAYGSDSTYHIIGGEVIFRKKRQFSLNGPFLFNWHGRIYAHSSGSTEFHSYTTYSSEDGVDWEMVGGIRSHILSMIYHKGVFVGGGDSGRIVSSNDGAIWRETVLPKRKPVRSVIPFGDGFVALADSTTLYQSSDGNTWNELLPDLRRMHFKLLPFKDTMYAIDKNGVWKSGNGSHWESSLQDSTKLGADLVSDGNTIIYGNRRKLMIKTQNADWTSAEIPYTTIAGCGDGIWLSRGDTIYKVAANNTLENYAEIPASTGIIKMVCGNGKLLAMTADSLLLFEKGQRIFGAFPNHSPSRITGAVFLEKKLFPYGMDGRIFQIDLAQPSTTSDNVVRSLRWRSISKGIQIESPDSRLPLIFDQLGRPNRITRVNRSSKNTSIDIEIKSSSIVFVKFEKDVYKVLAP